MIYGEWLPMQALLDKMMNDGAAAGDEFKYGWRSRPPSTGRPQRPDATEWMPAT